MPLVAISRPFLNLGDPPSLSLIAMTVKSAFLVGASQPVSTNVLSLTQGVLRNMLFHKIKIASAALLVVDRSPESRAHLRCGPHKSRGGSP